MRPRLRALLELLARPRASPLVVALGVALLLPSVGERFVFDDNTLAVLLRSDPGVAGHRHRPLDLFVFASGERAAVRAMVEQGVLAWWSWEELRLAFWRPLSSLTHLVDGTLWPDSARLAHLHSLAWYAALLAVVAAVYRRFAPPRLAGLALLLYALDDAHAQTIGWIANRNAAVASLLGLCALLAHDAWRRQGKPAGGPLAALCFVLGLLGGEMALGVLGYLVAHALFLDPGPPRRRMAALLPYAAIVCVWSLVYRRLDHGAAGSDTYVDPGVEPLAWLAVLPERLAMLLMGQLGAPGADTAFWSPPAAHWILWLAAGVTIAAAAWLLGPIVRREPQARFWAAGMLIAALPVTASFSSDRQLLLVGVGAMALFAAAIEGWIDASTGRVDGLLAAGFALLHGVVAPVLAPLRARSLETLGRALDRADRSIPSDPSIRRKSVVIANAPISQLASWLHVMRERRGAPRPAQIVWLATATSPLEITRSAERSLRVRPEQGYLWTEPDRLFRAARHPLAVGSRVALGRLSATVEAATPDGRPATVRFDFEEPLEADRWLWLSWQDGRYVPFVPPALGRTASFPAEDFLRILIREAARD